MSTRTEPTDDYEAAVVAGEGAVVARDKVVARKAFWLMLPMLIIALIATIAVAAGAEPAASPFMAVLPGAWFALTAWVMLTKISIRSVLTTRELQVHWGLRRWKIPLDAITKCEAVAPLTKGLPNATFAVNSWAPKGMVHVHWRDDAGKEKQLQFPADDPTGFAKLIGEGRDRTASTARIADAGDAADVAAEEELAQEEAEEARKVERR